MWEELGIMCCNKDCSKVIFIVPHMRDDILGEDLILIYNLGVELNMETPHRDSFHSLAFDHLF